MNQYASQKQGRKKKAYNMRKGLKEERALSLSLGSMTLIIVMMAAVGGVCILSQELVKSLQEFWRQIFL